MACDFNAIICSACSGSPLQSQLAGLSRLDLLRAMYVMQCQINKNGNAGFDCAAIDPCIACLSDSQKVTVIASVLCGP
jgi:hypothetical protein